MRRHDAFKVATKKRRRIILVHKQTTHQNPKAKIAVLSGFSLLMAQQMPIMCAS